MEEYTQIIGLPQWEVSAVIGLMHTKDYQSEQESAFIDSIIEKGYRTSIRQRKGFLVEAVEKMTTLAPILGLDLKIDKFVNNSYMLSIAPKNLEDLTHTVKDPIPKLYVGETGTYLMEHKSPEEVIFLIALGSLLE